MVYSNHFGAYSIHLSIKYTNLCLLYSAAHQPCCSSLFFRRQWPGDWKFYYSCRFGRVSVQGEFLESGEVLARFWCQIQYTYSVWKVGRVLIASQGALEASYIYSFGSLEASCVRLAGTFGSLVGNFWSLAETFRSSFIQFWGAWHGVWEPIDKRMDGLPGACKTDHTVSQRCHHCPSLLLNRSESRIQSCTIIGIWETVSLLPPRSENII